MTVRAIWKGSLHIGRNEVAVKMYSAVRPRPVDFRMLHRTDLEPVQQRIVRKSDGKEVAAAERRKAFRLDAKRSVILQPKELERLEPASSRRIATCHFVPFDAVEQQAYDQPYYLGPDESDADYFALAAALARQKAVGIVRWTMRTKRYLGALVVDAGHLLLITLRRADQFIALPETAAPALDGKELRLARQLVDLAADDFDPHAWKDEYRRRLLALVEEKRRGKRKQLAPPKARRSRGSLAAQLRLSLEKAKKDN